MQDWLLHNTGATLALLRFCVDRGVKRFVLGSTWSVYGDPTRRASVSERADPAPVDGYSLSKLAAETLSVPFAFVHGLSAAILRFGYIVGQGMLSRLHGALVTKGLASSVSGGLMLHRASSELMFSAAALPGVGADVIEPAFDQALAEVAEQGISAREFDDMKQSFVASRVYDDDNLTTHCNVIGSLMVAGWSLDDIEGFQARLEDTTVEVVNRAGKSILAHSRNVTGLLVPQRVQAAAAGLDR